MPHDRTPPTIHLWILSLMSPCPCSVFLYRQCVSPLPVLVILNIVAFYSCILASASIPPSSHWTITILARFVTELGTAKQRLTTDHSFVGGSCAALQTIQRPFAFGHQDTYTTHTTPTLLNNRSRDISAPDTQQSCRSYSHLHHLVRAHPLPHLHPYDKCHWPLRLRLFLRIAWIVFHADLGMQIVEFLP